MTECTEPYWKIIPGITNWLYPTIIANNLSHSPAPWDNDTLSGQITSELNKYLQEAADRCKTEDNYFDGCHRSANTSQVQQEAFLHQEAVTGSHFDPTITETPESQDDDTSSTPPTITTSQNDQLSTIPEEDNDDQWDPAEQDTLVLDSESNQSDNDHFDTAIDTSDDSIITMGQPCTAAFISELVHIATEQVGFL